jgi:hypothetical protein
MLSTIYGSVEALLIWYGVMPGNDERPDEEYSSGPLISIDLDRIQSRQLYPGFPGSSRGGTVFGGTCLPEPDISRPIPT